MQALFIYLLKAGCILAICYTAWHLLLRKETFYQYNRIWLLSGYICSLMLPLLPMPSIALLSPQLGVAKRVAAPVSRMLDPVTIRVTADGGTGWLAGPWQWLTLIYVLVAGILLLLHVLQLLHVRKLKRSGVVIAAAPYLLVYSKQVTTPFSFGHSIFLPCDSYDPDTLHQVLLHEKAHASQRHTWDTVFAACYCCLCWYNPFAWMMKRALLLNLEYLADAAVLEQQVPRGQYQHNLLAIGVFRHTRSIVNRFGHSYLKNRITMMNKLPSRTASKLKYLMAIPAIGIAIGLSAAGNEPRRPSPEMPAFTSMALNDTLPGFPGGKKAFAKFVAQRVRYPRAAQEQGVTGVVEAQYTILADGTPTNVIILKQPAASNLMGEEVKRVLALMPKFETSPGNKTPVQRTVSVKFMLNRPDNTMADAAPGVKTDVVVVGYAPASKPSQGR
ncbi:TonB family protein [Chitinophaga agrisoli]|uniref:TonB family protein n=1 Tax=Chitinophaga agrisoli TaxID=2607653 RepID=A0A5B2W3G1_9BACT|nr:TonB family protein [Chitinophaga agrisoli]KAA2244809.1 TonB family protein [Chitinophaga agrisoli]